jgi:hypothetical protein
MKSPGHYFVLLLVGISLLAAAGTFWNYSRFVFSTNHAMVINNDGRIEARFSPAVTAKLHPHQQAKITLANTPETALQAEVVTVVRGAVLLQVLDHAKSFSPGEACEVTIDTTISQ